MDRRHSYPRLARAAKLVQSNDMFGLSINRFDADPQAVTDILDLQPSSVGRKGEKKLESGKVQRVNTWRLETHPERLFGGVEHEAGLTSIIEQLRGRASRFTRLRDEIRPEIITLYGGLFVRHDSQCGIWLDPDHMGVLASCGVAWGIDIFIED